MDQQTLKILRFLIPGIIFSILGAPFVSYLPNLPDTSVVETPIFKIGGASFCVLFFYAAFSFRELSNKYYSLDIQNEIQSKIWEIAHPGLPTDPKWKWKHAKSIFYKLIDNDESLKVKAKNAYWNGFLWTTSADFRAISVICLSISLFVWWCDGMNFAQYKHELNSWNILYIVIFLLSFISSAVLTNRHVFIGKEQLDHIHLHHESEVVSLVAKSLAIP